MGLRTLARRVLVPEVRTPQVVERSDEIGFQQWVDYFSYLGSTYAAQMGGGASQLGSNERIAGNYAGFAEQGFKGNSVVFGAMAFRMRVGSEARFQFQRIVKGRPGELFGNEELALLERPQPGWTTGDLLARVIIDVDLAGTSFTANRNGRLVRLRPDWVAIISGVRGRDVSAWHPDAEILGYLYWPGGPAATTEPMTFAANQVAIVAPYPDPVAPVRGVSWLQSVLVDIDADTAATIHKLKFFQNGATIGQTVVLEGIDDPDVFDKWIAKFNEAHQGVANAYKTLFLTMGAKPFPTGTTPQQMEFKATQGAGETRIALAAGIHPVVLGLSEGLQGSSLNAGNYATARRSTADGALRPLWRNIAGSFERIIRVPGNARLWYDDRDVPFLREDARDVAEIQAIRAETIAKLVKEGFPASSAVQAVMADDLKLLQDTHTGLVSVQLQDPTKTAEQSTNGEVVPTQNGQQPEEVPA
jgi:hypothetical protein